MHRSDGLFWRKVSRGRWGLVCFEVSIDVGRFIAVADAESGNPKAMYETAYGGFADLHPEVPNEVKHNLILQPSQN